MPGPNGEQCSTCYFYEQTTPTAGYCHFDYPRLYSNQPGNQPGYWPSTTDPEWCGNWRDRTSPGTGSLATAGAITPASTAYSITGGGAWQHYNPGTMYASSITYNATVSNDTITWNIPGTFPPTAIFVADWALFGSVTYANSAQDVQWTLGDDTNVPFSNDLIQRIDITNQTDDISLSFGFAGGPAVSSQTGTIRTLVKSTANEDVTINSLFFQARITVL